MAQLAGLVGDVVLALTIRLVLIALVAALAIWLIRTVEHRLTGRVERDETDAGRQARLRTLINTSAQTAITIVLITAVLMALYQFGINIAPVLATVGIAGLAVSLGAQSLIKDFIGGFLILVEDQFRVGDTIQVGSTLGTVEQITLRATLMRDFQGQLWIVPNGEVRIVANQSRAWARAIVDLNVAFDADMAQALPALTEAMARAGEDVAIKPLLLEPPQVVAWNSFNEWAVQVRLMAKALPGKQGEVARVLRQYALDALRAANVRMALPTRDVRN